MLVVTAISVLLGWPAKICALCRHEEFVASSLPSLYFSLSHPSRSSLSLPSHSPISPSPLDLIAFFQKILLRSKILRYLPFQPRHGHIAPRPATSSPGIFTGPTATPTAPPDGHHPPRRPVSRTEIYKTTYIRARHEERHTPRHGRHIPPKRGKKTAPCRWSPRRWFPREALRCLCRSPRPCPNPSPTPVPLP